MLAEISETLSTVVHNIADMLLYDAEAPMLFSSGLFWLLFIFFLPVYAILKKSKTKMVVFVVGFPFTSTISLPDFSSLCSSALRL